ncbi:hypothetical protein FHR32_005087 [Streptosporangium album]|uniref:Uncharacterized protein n=1 Tax=Streptosporangium album TaxID=47479 RepID=A0A7W7WBV9_9ACTN|nr:hypothetical protein [Streptosporangium album]MBB4940710.1 hypothetical protein [Streptosporangium album]
MSAETIAPHADCAEVRRLVAVEFAAHKEQLLQRFAQDVERTLMAMRPTVHDGETWVAAATFEASARVALRLAGLPADLKEASQ